MKHRIAESIRMMRRYKLRSFFMSIGVVIGVAALVILRSYGSSTEEAMREKINQVFGANNIFITAGGRDMSASNTITSFTLEDMEALAADHPEIAAWAPMYNLPLEEISYKGQTHSAPIKGASLSGDMVWQLSMADGHYFSAFDLENRARVALLAPKTAKALFGDDNPIGKQILIGSVPFKVKGLLQPQGFDPHGIDRDDEIHVPISTLMTRLAKVDHIQGAKIVSSNPENIEQLAASLQKKLKERHAIGPGENADFFMVTPKLVSEMIGKMNRTFKLFLPAVALLILLIAALVISGIMLTTIRERFSEIGLRKALGATRQQIMMQFILETTSITVISGIFGVVLGVGTTLVLAKMSGLPAIISIQAMTVGLISAITTGLVAGLLPAKRAADLNPLETLR